MSIWSTRSSGRDRNYIVMRHSLRGVNYIINGIRFRDSYAIVEKDSKTYRNLKQIPVLRNAEEYPLSFLRKLKFITRPLDVRNVYGADVYAQYLKELEVELVKESVEKKVVEEVKHTEENKLCAMKTEFSGGKDLCKEPALDVSPSGYCSRHILSEPKLQELGIEIPRFIPKKEKAGYREKVIKELTKLKKEISV